MRKSTFTSLGAILLILSGLFVISCGKSSDQPDKVAGVSRTALRKIVFIGIDGADWRIINPLFEQGRLPNLKKIVDGGASGQLRTIEPILSPLIWTTMATGKLPEEHGILNFTVDDPETGRKVPITRMYRRVDAFWNMLGDYQRTVDMIGWLATYPAEEINGTMVTDRVGYLAYADFGDKAPPPGAIYPPGQYDEITGLLALSEDIPVEDIQRMVHLEAAEIEKSRAGTFDLNNPVNSLLLIYSTAVSHRNIALHLLDQGQPDFLGVYYELLDAACHLFMPYAPPRQDGTPAEDYEKYKDAVAAVYDVQDEIIGEMLERIGPNTVVMVASDHGFKSGPARLSSTAEIGGGHAAQWHELDGVICMYGEGIRPGSRIENASVVDITPTILALTGLPKPDDMPGKILEDVFDYALRSKINRTAVASLERERPHENPALAPSGAMDEAELKRLEALGYITAENPDALNNLGQRYQKQGKYEKAVVEFEKAIAMRPNFSKALNNVGTSYGALERYPEAERSFLKALELNPKDIYAMNNLAVMYLKTRQLDKSIEWGKKAIALEPKYTNGHITLGSAYATQGELDLAERHFRAALEIDPDNRTALSNLGKLEKQKRTRP